MTENENTEREPRPSTFPKGSGAMIGRFIAIGLFVALGTCAVIQSLSMGPISEEAAKNTEKDPKLLETDKELEPGKITPISSNKKIDLVNSPLKKDEKKASIPPSIIAKNNGKTVSTTFKPVTQVPTQDSVANRFGSKSTFQTNSNSITPISQKKPSAFPPQNQPPKNRIAMLDGGSPKSSVGIGGPAIEPAKTAAQKVGGAVQDLTNKAKDAASSTADRFGQAGNTLKNKASNAVDRVTNSFGQRPGSTAFKGATANTSKPVVKSSPFASSNQIKPIEAKPTIDSMNKRPFASKPQGQGSTFRSQSLNPMSQVSTQISRTPQSTGFPNRPAAPQKVGSTFPPNSGQNSNKPSSPVTAPRTSLTGMNKRFPPVSNRPATTTRPTQISPRTAVQSQPPRTQLPSATRPVPVVKAGYVSPKPGDRQFEGVQAPAMTIQKTSPREIQVNQVADFIVKIRNMGRIAVDDVLVVDQVPEGAQFVDANPKPSSQSRAGELRWELGTMNPGEERTILLQLKPTVAGEIGSVAQFYFGGRASNRTKVTQPKLKISHTSDPKILIGNDVVFDVLVENTGNGPAKDVIIQEEVPELLEFQDGSRELEYEIGTLMPGQSRRVKLGLNAARVGRLKNVMFASAKGGLQARDEIDVEIVAPKLATASEGPTRLYIQRKGAHTFTVANNGTAKATNLQLIARLPAGLRFVNANNKGRYDRNSHAVIWQMRDLSAGGSGNVEITTTPIEAGEQNITFEAVADLNQKSQTVQNLRVDHLIDVFFDIDDVADPIEVGANTRYRIRMINQGTQAASKVQLLIKFPNGLKPTAVDSDLRNRILGQQIEFEPITSLRPGEEMNVTVQAVGNEEGDHRVVVQMSADGRAAVNKEETTKVYSDR